MLLLPLRTAQNNFLKKNCFYGLLENAINLGFKCTQVEEKGKTILCLWKQFFFLSPYIKILDKRGELRKVVNVTGFLIVFEADELHIGESYTITLSKSHTSLTLIGTSEHLDGCIIMMSRCINIVI